MTDILSVAVAVVVAVYLGLCIVHPRKPAKWCAMCWFCGGGGEQHQHHDDAIGVWIVKVGVDAEKTGCPKCGSRNVMVCGQAQLGKPWFMACGECQHEYEVVVTAWELRSLR